MQHEITKSLSEAHRNMERVLMLIRLQVDTLRPGEDGSAFTLLNNALGYMHNYPGLIHHPTEDIVFRKLLRHAPQLRIVCVRLSEQHQDFRWREADLLRQIPVAQAGDLKACRYLKEASISYCMEHASHIRSEEIEVFPQAVKWLDAGDWQEVSERSRTLIDPALEQDELRQYSNLYDYLMTAGRNFSIH